MELMRRKPRDPSIPEREVQLALEEYRYGGNRLAKLCSTRLESSFRSTISNLSDYRKELPIPLRGVLYAIAPVIGPLLFALNLGVSHFPEHNDSETGKHIAWYND